MLSLHTRRSSSSTSRGFSLVEVLVALAVVGLVLAAAVPATSRFYDNLQRREAIRDVRNLLIAARETALTTGNAQDVRIRPSARRISAGRKEVTLPRGLTVTAHGAAELNLDNVGVIRFYPDGSASGGGVDVRGADGALTRITVDWLVGRVEMERVAGR